MATQQPFMALGQSYYRNPPFNLADLQQVTSTSGGTSHVGISMGIGNPALSQSTFRAPAHRHAHHLHSIPPREKGTRTLIIDHMLWVHGQTVFPVILDVNTLIKFVTGRTRFSQARAELGMTDRTGGPHSLNHIHRTRPEGYDEEDEEDSEGEEVIVLKARTGDPNHPLNDDDDRFRRQDLALARTLRLRAEGLEKVITSMLEQPPPIHPLTNDDVSTNDQPDFKDLHRLPNGVRLRLALGTIINDLFARQPFHPPYRHTHPPRTPKPGHISLQEYSPIASPSDLPDVLRALAPISGAFAPRHQPPPHQPSPSPVNLHSPAYSDFAAQYSQPSPNPAQIPYQTFHPQPSSPERKSLPHPTQRTRELYFTGSDPSTANCPPALRCPRHLQNGCEICTEEKSPPRPMASSPHGRSGQRGSVSSFWKATPGSIGITGWQEGTGIGSGLLRPAVRGSALRRTVIENDMTAGAGNTKLSKLIPRFLRLSALVAAELGREARGEEVDSASEDGRAHGNGGDNDGGIMTTAPSGGVETSPTLSGNVGTRGMSPWRGGNNSGGGGGYGSLPSSPIMRRVGRVGQNSPETRARERVRMYEKALRPSREWYMLLAGLLTRAVLEGYLTAGWSGLQAVQCLLLVGLGINENLGSKDTNEQDEDAQFASLDPDELPDLMQAIKILFPSSRAGSFGVKDQAEEEYEMEMLERLRRVRTFCLKVE